MAILLVIFFHIWGQLVGDRVTILLYTIHVPTFFWVSGKLLRKTLHKYSTKEIICSKIYELMAPFGVWTILLAIWECVIDFLITSRVNFTNNLIQAIYELWFFPCLFIACIFLLVCGRLKINNWIVSILLVSVFVCVAFWSRMIAKVLMCILITMIGYMQVNFSKIKVCKICVLYAILFLIIFYVIGVTGSAEAQTGWQLVAIEGVKMVGCMVIPGIAWLCESSKNNKLCYIFAKIGSKTKEIYILHFSLVAIYSHMKERNFVWAVVFSCACVILVMLVIKSNEKKEMIEKKLLLD